MSQMFVHNIDKFTMLSETLAISGQPSASQFEFIKTAGYQLIIRVKIEEVESPIVDERTVVLEQGMLYEEVSISFNNPTKSAFEQISSILNQYENLNIYVHCTMGYCTSGLLLPYLMIYKNYSMDEALKKVTVQHFNKTWRTFIENLLDEHLPQQN